jgi:hypothetical protein|tara:strand:- start:48 stop:1055 length:1008 start_codon:yes stop_codon:yes gene_type:complete
MAVVTTANAIGARESLADVIYRIDPDEVPVLSSLKKGTRANTLFDWQVQELAAATTANAQAEGATISSYDDNLTSRLQNQMQIAFKAFKVSDTIDAVDTAGRERESAYQSLLAGITLRRDIEKILTSDQAKSTSGNRKCATLSSWITNTSLGASATANSSFDGDGVDLPVTDATTDSGGDGIADDYGTPRALSVDLIETVMQAAYEDGGNPSLMVMSPIQKRKFSTAAITSQGTSTINNQVNMTTPKAGTSVSSISVFLSDFGQLDTVVDRFMPNERVYLLDPEFAEYVTLPGRDFVKQDLAKEGDSTRGFVLSEFSMQISAPKAHGAIYALTNS